MKIFSRMAIAITIFWPAVYAALSITQFNGDTTHNLDTSDYAGGVVHDWAIWQDPTLGQPLEGTASANYTSQTIHLADLNGGTGAVIESMHGGNLIGSLNKIENDNGTTWSHNSGLTNLYPLVTASNSGTFNWTNGSNTAVGSMNGNAGFGTGNYSNYTNSNEPSANFNINSGDGFRFNVSSLTPLASGGFYELRVFYATFAVPVEFSITNGLDTEIFTTGLGYERGYISFQINGDNITNNTQIDILTRDTDNNGNFGIMGVQLQSNVTTIPEPSSTFLITFAFIGMAFRRSRRQPKNLHSKMPNHSAEV